MNYPNKVRGSDQEKGHLKSVDKTCCVYKKVSFANTVFKNCTKGSNIILKPLVHYFLEYVCDLICKVMHFGFVKTFINPRVML